MSASARRSKIRKELITVGSTMLLCRLLHANEENIRISHILCSESNEVAECKALFGVKMQLQCFSICNHALFS